MALKEGDRQNFNTLVEACRNGDLALLQSACARTGEYRALICAVGNGDATDEMHIAPLGQMILGNPYELYLDPTVDELPEQPKRTDLVADLEALVDRHDMVHVMIGLELMCAEKAAFVDSAESIGTPDRKLARCWERVGRHCRKVADLAAEVLP